MQSREVALCYPDGEAEVLIVGEEARDLCQVRVGDQLTAEYHVFTMRMSERRRHGSSSGFCYGVRRVRHNGEIK